MKDSVQVLAMKSTARKTIVTVRHEGEGTGMGVLIDGNRIVTAAHCLPPLPERHMTPFLCDHYPVQVKQFGTHTWARCVLLSVDFCSDIAVLSDSTVDGVDLFDQQFELMTDHMESAPINLLAKDKGKKQPVYVFTHEGIWLKADLDLSQPWLRYHPFQRIMGATVFFNGEIKSGTSGSPVFDRHGAVIGVISQSSVAHGPQGKEKQRTILTILTGALPRWIVSDICRDDGSATEFVAKD